MLTAVSRVTAAAIAGGLLVLAFPPFGAWPLAIIAVAILALLARAVGWRMSAAVGFAFGLAFFLGLMPWMRVIGVDAWIGLSLYCAVYLAGLTLALTAVSRTRLWPLYMAALWVLEEAIRDRFPLGGYPWGRLAFANDTSTLTGWVAVGGAPLVTFLVALAGTLLAYCLVNLRARPVVSVAALAAAVAVTLSGALIPRPMDGERVAVAVVQGNVPRTGLDAFGQREAVLRGHVAATLELADAVEQGDEPQPQLVIWPENSSDIDPFQNPDAADLIDGAVRAIGVDTLVGVVAENEDGTGLENTGVVWSPESGPGARYVKRHPVPFGEYVPFRSLLAPLISRFDRVSRDFVAGEGSGVLPVGPVEVGDVICFEIAYDSLVRDVVRDGAEVLAVQTNNATYGRTGQVEQQLAISRLRAVEHSRSTLVAATSGISAIIAPDGKIQQQAPEFTRRVLVDEVLVRQTMSLATRLGAWPEYLLAIVGLVGLAVGVRNRRARRSG